MADETYQSRMNWMALKDAIAKGLARAEEGETPRTEEQIVGMVAEQVASTFHAPNALDEVLICKHFTELFPHYAYTDSETAIDLLRGEVLSLRTERDAFKDATKDAHRELAYLAEQVKARDGGSVRTAMEKCRSVLDRSSFFPVESVIEGNGV